MTWLKVIKFLLTNLPTIIRLLRELRRILEEDTDGEKIKEIEKERDRVKEAMCRLGLKDC